MSRVSLVRISPSPGAARGWTVHRESHVAIGGSLLIFRGDKLVAGTGRYQHATGRAVSNKTVYEKSNTSDTVVRINLGG